MIFKYIVVNICMLIAGFLIGTVDKKLRYNKLVIKDGLIVGFGLVLSFNVSLIINLFVK